jgi:hypothetical protein
LKIKPGQIQKLKTIRGNTNRLIRPQNTTPNSRKHVFKILNTTSIICGENCQSSSWVQVYKPRNINALFSKHGS